MADVTYNDHTEETEMLDGDYIPFWKTAAGAVRKILLTNFAAQLNPNVLDSVYPVGSIYISAVSTNPATLLGGGTWAAFGTGRTLVGVDVGQTEFDTVEETGGEKTHTLTAAEMPVHTHTQDAHGHTQNAHGHTQNAHTHAQISHNHTQNSHLHSQPAHQHSFTQMKYSTFGPPGGGTVYMTNAGSDHGWLSDAAAPNTNGQTAVNNGATAANLNATATNQNATATNQNATATNQNAGSGSAHNNLQPYITVYMWKRTA